MSEHETARKLIQDLQTRADALPPVRLPDLPVRPALRCLFHAESRGLAVLCREDGQFQIECGCGARGPIGGSPQAAEDLWRAREDSRLAAEADRLAEWLKKIEGGDNPCTDEDQLRTWAYEALTLGRTAS